MRNLRTALFWFLTLYMPVVLVKAQVVNATDQQGRHITPEQIKVLEKALASQPKGTILFAGLALFPPPPPAISPPPQLPTPESQSLKPLVAEWNHQQKSSVSVDPKLEEAKAFTEQLWNLLQKCGYATDLRGGSHGLPPPGISIHVLYHKGKPMADALRKSLIASGIQNIQIKEDSNEEAYYSKNFPSDKWLTEITIGPE